MRGEEDSSLYNQISALAECRDGASEECCLSWGQASHCLPEANIEQLQGALADKQGLECSKIPPLRGTHVQGKASHALKQNLWSLQGFRRSRLTHKHRTSWMVPASHQDMRR